MLVVCGHETLFAKSCECTKTNRLRVDLTRIYDRSNIRAATDCDSAPQILIEPGNRALPGKLCGRLVVSHGRRVVVKAVVRPRIDIPFVRDFRGGEGRVVR